MSASAQPGLPPRKFQAGGFEQRMAKGPDGERTIHLYLCNFKLFSFLICCISLFLELIPKRCVRYQLREGSRALAAEVVAHSL